MGADRLLFHHDLHDLSQTAYPQQAAAHGIYPHNAAQTVLARIKTLDFIIYPPRSLGAGLFVCCSLWLLCCSKGSPDPLELKCRWQGIWFCAICRDLQIPANQESLCLRSGGSPDPPGGFCSFSRTAGIFLFPDPPGYFCSFSKTAGIHSSGLKNNAVFGEECGTQCAFVWRKEEKIVGLTKINGGGNQRIKNL